MPSLLIVGDDMNLGPSVTRRMGRHAEQFDVFQAIGLAGAMRWLSLFSFDVLLIDRALSGGDDLELARHAKTVDPGMRVVMMTSAREPQFLEIARREGVVRFVETPFAARKLLAALLPAMDGAE